jgi:hypothetical protein
MLDGLYNEYRNLEYYALYAPLALLQRYPLFRKAPPERGGG